MEKKDTTNGLPCAPEMEQAVLGILMLESENADNWRKVSRLTPAMFSDPKHKYIFNTIRKLASNGTSYNLLLVINAMRDDGMADPETNYYLTGLTSKVSSNANIEHFALIVEQKWIAREMILEFESKAAALRKNGDPLEVMDKTKLKLVEITPRSGQRLVSAQDMWPVIAKGLEENVARLAKGITLAGVPSGFRSVDNLTLGWMPGEYYLFAGRPAMGKTAFALALTAAAAMAGYPVHFTSLEMGAASLIKRIIAYQTEVSTWRMRKGDLSAEDFKRMNAAADRALKNIYIEDGSARDIDGIYNSCYGFTLQKKQETDKHPVFFLDYAQLTDAVSPSAKAMMNREQVISSVSRGWKAICKDMNGPGIALSQLSRAVESRAGDKKPQMSDLRESGSLEQDADLIGFLYRPEYYDIETYFDGSSTKNTGQLLIEKYREGDTGECLLGFTGSRGWFNHGDGYADNEDSFPDPRRVVPIVRNPSEPNTAQESGGGDFFPF